MCCTIHSNFKTSSSCIIKLPCMFIVTQLLAIVSFIFNYLSLECFTIVLQAEI